DFVARGEANLTLLFARIDLARASAAVGNRPAPFDDAERGAMLVYRAPKMGAARRDVDAELWSSPALYSRGVGTELKGPMPAAFLGHQDARFEQDQVDVAHMIELDGMADVLGRSCERRLNPPQMCQLISLSSCAM